MESKQKRQELSLQVKKNNAEEATKLLLRNSPSKKTKISQGTRFWTICTTSLVSVRTACNSSISALTLPLYHSYDFDFDDWWTCNFLLLIFEFFFYLTSFFTDCPDEERLATLRFSHPNSSGQEYALVPGKNAWWRNVFVFFMNISVLWIRSRPDRHHFGGYRTVSISAKYKAKAYFKMICYTCLYINVNFKNVLCFCPVCG